MMQERKKLLEDIRKALIADGLDAPKEQLTVFIQAFLDQIPDDDLQRLGCDGLSRLSYSVWNLIRSRQIGTPKHRVYRWIPDTDSVVADRLVIDMINDDKPFLVDSLTGLLRVYGLNPHILVHPVFQLKRDNEGKLLSISPSNRKQQRDDSCHYESVIHCQIRDKVDAETVQKIRQDLPKALADIHLATRDWQAMRERIYQIMLQCNQSESCSPEFHAFLSWVREHHFTLLGACTYDISTPTKKNSVTFCPHSPLGIMSNKALQDFSVLFEGIADYKEAEKYLLDDDDLIVNKSSQPSRVHRCVPMDVIGVKERDGTGNVTKLHLFVGLFTSEAYDSSARAIPLLRQKVVHIVQEAGFSTDWHDGKALVHILDSLPRDELFQTSVKELAQMSTTILSTQSRHQVRVFVREDRLKRFLSCLVYVPKDAFDMNLSTKMRAVLEDYYKNPVSLVKAQFGDFAFARVHFRIDLSSEKTPHKGTKQIEDRLALMTQSWSDRLRRLYYATHDERTSDHMMSRYAEAFTQSYQDAFDAKEAQKDIEGLEEMIQTGKPYAALDVSSTDEIQHVNLKFSNWGVPLPLSSILPRLENMGMHVSIEVPYKIKPKGIDQSIWLHSFVIIPEGGQQLDKKQQGNFLDLLSRLWSKETEDDGFNKLALHAQLTWRECMLIRAYGRYLHQLRTPYSSRFMQRILARHSDFVKNLVKLFHTRLNPEMAAIDKEKRLVSQLYKYLNDVENAEEDHLLRLYISLIESTLRTNYFQHDNQGNLKSYLSLKFDCATIEAMPLPRPMFEIFVYAMTMEGVHLRSGKVARGGLRWSDRYEDYRTEILGLMKAQVVKNTVIVPTGSKGGFVLKSDLESLSREERNEKGVEAYQTFIRGLLDLTDNLIDDKTVHPPQVVCCDDADSYLVVAADKGTATFSDYANAVSKEYDFWLGDAFASGGSAGYDHKKMGITARGAWASVQHHFYGLGLDVQKDPITVVGVGDMSGDVFGNGMLLSKQIKLVAAFNHRHIFIDPHPEPATSFKERQRLFKLKRSSWSDYNPALISKGGAVFDRSAKSIDLSPEIKVFLGISQDKLTPPELMRLLLKAQVDLIWFGGIGTYIKSKNQSHSDAGDRANDKVRVDAVDLRCRVIGEGANLGVTQPARIEFGREGGRINTDFIDNSAGVDTSDHEVNLKILTQQLIRGGKLTVEKRDAFLSDMTKDVAQLVLQDNEKQNMTISFIESQGYHLLDAQANLMRLLESDGLLNRQLENLPDESVLGDYAKRQIGFVRPEISTLISYAKLTLEKVVLQTSLAQDAYFEKALLSYFPEKLSQDFDKEIHHHPLRTELITTYIVNEVVNRMGAAFVHDMADKTGDTHIDIIQAYFIVHELAQLESLWRDLDLLAQNVPCDGILQARQYIWKTVQRMIHWWVQWAKQGLDIQKMIGGFQGGINDITTHLEDCLNTEQSVDVTADYQRFIELGFPETFARKISLLKPMVSFPEMIVLAGQTESAVLQSASTYLNVGELFGFDWLRGCVELLKSTDGWHRLALSMMTSDFDHCQSALTKKVILFNQQQSKQDNMVEKWCDANQIAVGRVQRSIERAQATGDISLAFLTVIVRQMRQLVEQV